MKNVLVSIIVPIYNREKYIKPCVDSLLNQTYTNTEILLINDGSTDRSGSICDDYASRDSRVRVFHLKHRGVSAARNKGLIEALGDKIMFCDSDDIVSAKWVEILAGELQVHLAHPIGRICEANRPRCGASVLS